MFRLLHKSLSDIRFFRVHAIILSRNPIVYTPVSERRMVWVVEDDPET